MESCEFNIKVIKENYFINFPHTACNTFIHIFLKITLPLLLKHTTFH